MSAFGEAARSAHGACPCGTGRSFDACCGPLLRRDREAATAEELMRSRYTAYATGDVDHLVRTWHPAHRPGDLDLDPTLEWVGLVVEDVVAGGSGDSEGHVTFRASWRQGSERGRMREVSTFTRRAGRWVYVNGRDG